jgi:uncharacterized protein YeaO (DUF488 family)
MSEIQISQGNHRMPISSVLKYVPMDEVKKALCLTKRNDRRERKMPNKQTVYFTIAMSLFSASSYQDVLLNLRDTVDLTEGYSEAAKLIAKSAISKARQRLGYEPLERLFECVVRPIAVAGKTKGAFAFGLRVVAIDGMLLDVPDTPKNDKEFTRSSTASGPCAYPQARVVALVECGTRVLFDYIIGKKDSEKALGRELLPRLEKGQLCLADRLYSDYKTWTIAQKTGADLLWRVKGDIKLEKLEVYKDGSYRSLLSGKDGSADVRVVEYVVRHKGNTEQYRLITTLNAKVAPANKLKDLYQERWEWESFADEFKTELNQVRDVLRSNLPDLVRQEIIASFLAHYAIRCFMHDAALSAKLDTDNLSFKHSLGVIRRTLSGLRAFSP